MQRKWWTLIAVCVATFMLLLDITVVNTALPSIRRDLNASFTDLQWVVDAYALTLAAFVLTSGSLADRLGRSLHQFRDDWRESMDGERNPRRDLRLSRLLCGRCDGVTVGRL